MSLTDNPAPVATSGVDAAAADRLAGALRAAGAAAPLLPVAAGPLQAGEPQPATALTLDAWAGAALARLDRVTDGWVGVLVQADLVDALASAPMGQLDLGAAVQPALDAAAGALSTTAAAATTAQPALLADTLGAAFAGCLAVPLVADGTPHAVVLVAGPASPAASANPLSGAVAGALPGGSGGMVGAGGAGAPVGAVPRTGIELLHGVSMEVTVELGRTRMSVRELLNLAPGEVIELDRVAGSPADLLVNGRLIARGEVVVVDEDYALRVTEIVTDPTAS